MDKPFLALLTPELRKMFNPPTRRRSHRTANRETRGRRLRMEPLEDRRMLSVTLFVDADAATGGDGLAWSTAYDQLQAALDDASARNADEIAENNVDEIWIAEGTYLPTAELEAGEPRSVSFSLVDGVTLHGGFAGTEAALEERDLAGGHETVLSGDVGVAGDDADNAYTVVYCAEDVEAGVEGVTVTGGRADDDVTSGGGLRNSGTLEIANAVFAGNWAQYNGGAILNAGSMRLTHSLLVGNTGERNGGAISNSRFLEITNSTITGNTSSRGGGIFSSNIPYGDPPSLLITNSIVALNTEDAIWGGLAEGSTNNLIGIDPGFVRNPGTNGVDDRGDLRLTGTSPAVDAGESGLIPADTFDLDQDGDTDESVPFDLQGDPRVFGVSVDIGAYECQAAPEPGRETPSTVVTTVADNVDLYDGAVSLREAVIYAGTGSLGTTITFAPQLSGSTIVLSGSSISIDRGVVVDASTLADGLIIDADAASRVLTVNAAASQPVELIGLTLQNGYAPNGGAVFNAGALTVRNSTLTKNTTASSGGAIFNCYGSLDVVSSELTRNVAFFSGGGIQNSWGTARIIHSTLSGNNSRYNGGGVYNFYGSLFVSNSVVVGNTARSEGGGIHDDNGTFNVTNSTITGNTTGKGGGVCRFHSSPESTLQNSIIAGNSPSDLDDWGISGDFSVSHCLIGVAPDGLGSDGNIMGTEDAPVAPLFVRPPQDGGDGFGDDPYTANIDESANDDYGDLRLFPFSPGVDAGDDVFLPADEYDLDGDGDTVEPIPVDLSGGVRVIGTSVDMGAFERQPLGTAEAIDDGFNVTEGETIVFDPRDNDLVLPGYSPEVWIAQDVEHGTLSINDDGLCVYTPDEGFLGEDGFYYTLDTGDGIGDQTGFVLLNVTPSGALVVDSLEDVVNDDYSPGDLSLREAIAIASPGETLYVSGTLAGATISLSTFIALTQDVTLDGLWRAPVTLDGNRGAFWISATTETMIEGFRITGVTYAYGSAIQNAGTLTIRKLTISDNSGSQYPGIQNSKGTLVVEDCLFSNNRSSESGAGSAIRNSEGTLTIVDSTFSGNSAPSGGAIYSTGPTYIANSTFADNSATSGGAIFHQNSELTLISSTFTGNSSSERGGAVFAYNSEPFEVTDSIFSRNNATGNGGAIYLSGASLQLSHSALIENTSSSGAGLYNYGGTVKAVNTTFSANAAEEQGGAIVNDHGEYMLTGLTIFGNSAGTSGGGILEFITGRYRIMNNSIVAGNDAPSAPDMGSLSFTPLGKNNLIGDGSDCFGLIHGENGNQVGTAENPIDPLLAPLADNGGPTPTHALLPGSPALDAGYDALAIVGSDQRGLSRFHGTVDIGAFEAQPEGLAGTMPDGVDVVQDGSATFDILANDVIPEGYTAETILTETVKHGELTHNLDGTWTYEPDDGFLGEDVFCYKIDTGIGTLSREVMVLLSVIPSDAQLIDSVEDVVDGDLSPGNVGLREAIEDASAGETLYVSATLIGQPFHLHAGQLILEQDIAIYGFKTMPSTLDAQSRSAVFDVRPGIVAELCGLHITGGYTNWGGGIRNWGQLTVRNSIIEGNYATEKGGGIFNDDGTLHIVESVVSNNTAGSGGAIYNEEGTVVIEGSSMLNNSASGGGGGVCVLDGSLSVENSTFSANQAYGGGGVFSQYAVVYMSNVTLVGNTAREGGAILNYDGVLRIWNTTVSGNSAFEQGGGIYGYNNPLTLHNSIIAGNTAAYCNDVFALPYKMAASNNLIGDGTGFTGMTNGKDGNQVGTAENPIDPLLAPLADNGGPTPTCALLPGSPAVDAGNDTETSGVTDQRGWARFHQTVDIGAFELQPEGLAAVASDGVDVLQNGSATFDILTNDVIPTGYSAETIVTDNVKHGELIHNADGTWTYTPDEDFLGEDTFRYRLETQTGILSREVVVILNVIPAGCRLIDTVEDVVDGDLSPGHVGLREALENAVDGETLHISATLVGQRFYLESGGVVLDKDVTLRGFRASPMTVDAQLESTVVMVGSTAELDGFRITGGYASSAGGIFNAGDLTIRNSVIERNTATSGGGGIFNARTLHLVDSTVTKNSEGGGIYSSRGEVIANNSSIVDNSTSASGGGIRIGEGSLTLIKSTLAGNKAAEGGGLYNDSGTIEITDTMLVGNSAGSGGAILNSQGTLLITNATITGNYAFGLGGGINGENGETTVHNSIIAANIAGSGSDLYVSSGTLTGSHNLIGDGTGQTILIHGEDGNLVGTAEAPIDPCFVRAPSDGGDGWGDDPNTPDIDESANDDYGDLRLHPDSPAVDAGDDALLPEDVYDLDGDGDTAEPIPFDIDGNPRVLGDRVDMGAYEYVAVAVVPGDLNGDGMVGSPDLDIVRSNWGQAVAVGSLFDGDPSGDGRVGSDDLDIVRANWGRVATAGAARGVKTEITPRTDEAVYGPVRKQAIKKGFVPDDTRGVVFAQARLLTEAAWREAVESLEPRQERRSTTAVDAVISDWLR